MTQSLDVEVRLERLEDRLRALAAEVAGQGAALARLEALRDPAASWDVATWARFLAVGRESVLRMVRDGIMPFRRVGRQVRFSPADREAYLARSVGGRGKPFRPAQGPEPVAGGKR